MGNFYETEQGAGKARESFGGKMPFKFNIRTIRKIKKAKGDYNIISELTENYEEHPEWYDGDCYCKLCQSYGY